MTTYCREDNCKNCGEPIRRVVKSSYGSTGWYHTSNNKSLCPAPGTLAEPRES